MPPLTSASPPAALCQDSRGGRGAGAQCTNSVGETMSTCARCLCRGSSWDGGTLALDSVHTQAVAGPLAPQPRRHAKPPPTTLLTAIANACVCGGFWLGPSAPGT